MTRKQEIKRLERIVGDHADIKTLRFPTAKEKEQAKERLKELEGKDAKSKAHFLIFNEGRQKELKRRIKEVTLARRRYQEKKRMEAAKNAGMIINDFATEHNFKD